MNNYERALYSIPLLIGIIALAIAGVADIAASHELDTTGWHSADNYNPTPDTDPFNLGHDY